MRRPRHSRIVPLLVALAGFAAGLVPVGVCGGNGEITPLKVGTTVPGFSLRDLSGKTHRLGGRVSRRTRSRKAVVLAFNGLGCPIAELYARRLEGFYQKYRSRGVEVLGINSNRFDDVGDLRRFASGFGVTFPILKDRDNRLADILGVERMTEVLVLDASMKLRYRGRVDDQYSLTERSVGIRKDRAETEYLANAVDAVLAGKEVAVKVTEAPGCVIGRRRKVVDASSITFHRDVEPIVQKRCQPCHRDEQIAPFALLSYEDVAGWSGMIREVVVNRRMPPWHADPEYGHFSNDRSLCAKELETIVGWIDNGTPRGRARDRPKPVVYPAGWQIGTPDLVFEIPEPFPVPAEGVIDYQYSVVPTNLEEDRWVVASEVQAGERSVVHHILLFVIDPKNPRRWRRETGGGTRGYFSAMVPGERPVVYPRGMAKKLPAGATLVFQIHYTVNGVAALDRSRVGFRFTTEPITAEISTRSAFNQIGLAVPPGAERHEIRATHRFEDPVRLLSLLPHMHIRGESFRYVLHFPASARVSRPPSWEQFEVTAVERFGYDGSTGELTVLGKLPGDLGELLLGMYEGPDDRDAIRTLLAAGRSEILLNVPRYDFGWQNTYRFATPKFVPRGALLSCIAHFNNSAFNPALTRDLYSKYVVWGDQTWEEMLIGYFDFVDAEHSF